MIIVSVHVHEDGDIELTRHAKKPTGYFEDLIFQTEEALRKELMSYGVEESRINEALLQLVVESPVTV